METKVDIPPRESPRASREKTIEAGSIISAPATTPAPRTTRPTSLPSRLLPDFDKPQTDYYDERLPIKGRRLGVNIAIGLLMLALLVGAWWAVAVLGNSPPYILPTPPAVAERIWSMLLDG